MRRVFIHSSDAFPHGGAQPNYIQHLGLLCKEAGFSPVMIVRANGEYIDTKKSTYYMGMKVVPINASSNAAVHMRQREDGYSEERIQAMIEEGITLGDVIITFQLRYNKKFHCNLQRFCKKTGVKSIVGVLEYWGLEDLVVKEKYENFRTVADTIYLGYDGILVMSRMMDKYYREMGKKTFCFPPFMDCRDRETIKKKSDKFCFLISTKKDSLKAMLIAFACLEDSELKKMELHLCGIKETYIKEIMEPADWERLDKWTVVHPWINYNELMELYCQMHFLVIARKRCQRTLANFPSKVPETMAYGIVPIVSEVGDYTEYYLQNGHDSIFINGDSVEEIRKAVRKAINMSREEYEHYSECAYGTAKERFSYHVWIPEIKRMLESV